MTDRLWWYLPMEANVYGPQQPDVVRIFDSDHAQHKWRDEAYIIGWECSENPADFHLLKECKYD